MRALRIKIYPNQKQQQQIIQNIGAARYVYNRSLALKKGAYQKFGLSLNSVKLRNKIVHWKYREEAAWLQDANHQVLQQAVLNMDSAYKHFFRRLKTQPTNKKELGFPRFKSRHHARLTAKFANNIHVNFEKNKIRIPKIGWVKARNLREDFKGLTPKSTVIELDRTGSFYASILFHYTPPIKEAPIGTIVGLDMGIRNFVADTSGNAIPPLDLQQDLKKLRACYQKLSRTQKSSKRREQAKTRLNKQFKKITNKKNWYLHHVANYYAEKYQCIVVEDLKIKNMSRSAKGTIEEPGKNVRAKQSLNNKITQQNWGQFFSFLDYKLQEKKGMLIKVNPKHTSQKCSQCGHIEKENRKEENFLCLACGHKDHADVNAAHNILELGLA